MSFGRYLQRKLLDHALKTAAYTPPTNIKVALYTVAPGETGGGTEVSGVNYARVIHNVWAAASDASPAIASNTGIVQFATPGTGGWGHIVAFALWDDEGTPNLLGYANLTIEKDINQGDDVEFAEGDLQVTLD